jgi:VanZ family protein
MRLSLPLSTAHYRLLAGVWTAGMVVALGLPAESLGAAPPEVGADKIAHIVLFAGFGALWLRGLCPPAACDPARCFRWRGGLFFVAGALFAVGTEVYQHLLPVQRIADPYDATADLVGFVLAFVGYYAYHVRPARPHPADS